MSLGHPRLSRRLLADGCGAFRKMDAAAHGVRLKIVRAIPLTYAQNNRAGCWLQAINRVSDQWRLLTQLLPMFLPGSTPSITWIPHRQAQCGEPSRATARSIRE